MRQNLHYNSFGISNEFGYVQALHQREESQQVLDTEQGASPADHNFWIGGHKVGPLPGHGQDSLVGNLQQNLRAIPIISLPKTDELFVVVRMKRMRYSDKLRCGDGTGSIPK